MKIGCEKPATNNVCLSLAVNGDHEPAVSTPLLSLCNEHATECTWDNVGVDNMWETICVAFESIGRMRPLKEFSNLIIQPTDEQQ